MADNGPEIWSPSLFPYACLKDLPRTTAFRRAIQAIVSPGDIVIDAGSGTGILGFFAAEAGAAKVYAVEISPVLVGFLRASVERNGFGDRVEVVSGDATESALPAPVDVVICELIDTGLMEEMQAEVLNGLRRRGVIGPRTKLVPSRYSTFIELVDVDDRFFGFHIVGPKHEWPSFATDPVWYRTAIAPLTERALLTETDFGGLVEIHVSRALTLEGRQDGIATAVRIGGVAHLAPGIDVGATETINGDKILDLPRPIPVRARQPMSVSVSYTMGGGLSSFRCDAQPAAGI